MQVNLVGSDTHTSGSSGRAFGGKWGAKSFWMLSSGIYSRKALAVIREVSCNGNDAHTMSGQKGRPIEVWLPTAAKPVFQVRDYGPGLSEDQIYDLYTQYFESNKDGPGRDKFGGVTVSAEEGEAGAANPPEDEPTGGFGLGSKSPFAVTDQFTVTSAHGGKKAVYSCAVNSDRMPETVKLWEGDVDTDWPTGLMVSVPVPLSMVDEFWKEAHNAYRPFDTPPIFMDTDFSLGPRGDADARFGAVELRLPEYLGGAGLPIARMAQVDYPLALDSLNLTGDVKKFVAALTQAASRRMVVSLANGAVLPAPTRESLQYYRESIAHIVRVLEDAREHARSEVLALFDDLGKPKASELQALRDRANKIGVPPVAPAFAMFCESIQLNSRVTEAAQAGHVTAPGRHPQGVSVWWYDWNGDGTSTRRAVTNGTVSGGKTPLPLGMPFGFKVIIADADRIDSRVRHAVGNDKSFRRGALVLQRTDKAPMTPEDLTRSEAYLGQLMTSVTKASDMPLPPKRAVAPRKADRPVLKLAVWAWDPQANRFRVSTENLYEMQELGGVWLRKGRRRTSVDIESLAEAIAGAASAELDISAMPRYIVEVDAQLASKLPKDMPSLTSQLLTIAWGWIAAHGLGSPQPIPFNVDVGASRHMTVDWAWDQVIPPYLRGEQINKLRPILDQFTDPSPLVTGMRIRMNADRAAVARALALNHLLETARAPDFRHRLRLPSNGFVNPMANHVRLVPGLVPTQAGSLQAFEAMLSLHEQLWLVGQGKKATVREPQLQLKLR